MLDLHTCINVDAFFRKHYIHVFRVDICSVAAHYAWYLVPGPKRVEKCYEITVVIYKYLGSW
jgi:hypothetical protein